MGDYFCRYLTQIWTLDTENPSAANLSHLTTLEHDFTYREDYVYSMMMNDKILCLEIYTYDGEKLLLHVFHFSGLSSESHATVLELAKEEDNEVQLYNVRLDDLSNKIAVLLSDSILNVYTLEADTDPVCLKINLNNLDVKNPKNLLMANFLMGKSVLVLNSDSQFQCIIVTEDGEVVEGNKLEFQLGDVKHLTFTADGIISFSKSLNSEDRFVKF